MQLTLPPALAFLITLALFKFLGVSLLPLFLAILIGGIGSVVAILIWASLQKTPKPTKDLTSPQWAEKLREEKTEVVKVLPKEVPDYVPLYKTGLSGRNKEV